MPNFILRLIPTLSLLLLAVGMGSKRPDIPPPTTPKETLPSRTERLIKVHVKSLQGFNGEQELRFRHIAASVEKIVNLKLFEEMVKAHSYQGKNYFVDSTDTPAQVFEKITSTDWVLEYRLEALNPFSSVIGYTLPTVTWIAFNSRKWYSLSDADIAANICHEFGAHKLGRYNHSAKWNKARDYSVPYAIGTICSKLYGK